MEGPTNVIADIRDTDDPSFVRHWSERAFDHVQLAQIAKMQEEMVNYAMTAWRSMNVPPPYGVLLICMCEDGMVLMTQTEMGDWRTNQGQPRKPPRAWMPAPTPPKV